MNSRSYYRILYGWDVELWETVGIRYCAIFVKLTESLSDNLLVQYIDGTKRTVNGKLYLFTDKTLALVWLEDQKQKELTALNFKMIEIRAQIEKVEQRYLDIPIESAPQISIIE